MSIFCKAENCTKAKDCIHAFSWKLHKHDFPNSNPEEGYATGVWYIDEQKCIKNDYKEGAFWKQTQIVNNMKTMTEINLWIARDEDGSLYIYNHRPIMCEVNDEKIFTVDPNFVDVDCNNVLEVNSDLYPEVTFENSPKQIKEIIL